MTVNASRARPRRTAISVEEERAWVSFYQRARRDPAIAAEVLQQLDADGEMKREHLALYLCCRESLRLHKAREARNQRIGQFVRWLLRGFFVHAPSATRRAIGRGGDIAVACLPEVSAEPATAQVEQLASDPRVRAARKAFKGKAESQPQATAPAPTQAQPQAVRAGG